MKTLKSFLSVVFISLMVIACGSGGGDNSGSGGSGGSGGGSTGGQVSQESMDEFVSFFTNNTDCTSQSANASVKKINISSLLTSSVKSYSRYRSLPQPVKSVMQAVGPLDYSDGTCTNGTFTFTPITETNTKLEGLISAGQCVIGSGDSAIEIDGSLSFTLLGMNFDALVISDDSIEIPDLDTAGIEISGLTVSSSGITIQAGQENITISMNNSASFTTSNTGELSGLDATITSLSVVDNNENEQFGLTETNIVATGLDGDFVQINSNGTYTESGLGTFTFNTPTGLTFDSSVTNEETATGTIQVDGADGSDFLVTINDDDNIIINADVDGDGSTDFSETVNCSGQSLNPDDILS